MTKKYADLEPTIAVEESLDLRERWAAGVALRWIDEHPDQAPRPTISEGVKEHYLDSESPEWKWGFNTALALLHAETVPDPVPTNAEKIERLLRAADEANADQEFSRFAKFLDEQGVKAPGGDDE